MSEQYETVKFINDGIELDVNVSPQEETIWLSLDKISMLYERDRSVIGKHIKNIFKEKELEEKCKSYNIYKSNYNKCS